MGFIIWCLLIWFAFLYESDETKARKQQEKDEKVETNVFFYFPNGYEHYLGTATGVSDCSRVACNYANQKKLKPEHNWSYVCCTRENGSECHRKIR